jgi:TonB family protein
MQRLWMVAMIVSLGAGLVHTQQPIPVTLTNSQSAVAKNNPPKVINSVVAEFSDEARAKGIGGLCVVSITVDTEGKPQNIQIIQCTDPSFEKTSLEAAAKYQFNPATTPDGKPIAMKINLDVAYHLYGIIDPDMHIVFRFSSPPGTRSTDPSPDGVYPLTKLETPPLLAKFSDEEYRNAAYLASSPSACDIVLTIGTNGNASDPVVTHCERPDIEKPAIESLLKSKYKPGRLKGKAVPIRTSIHLQFGNDPAKP